MTDYHTHMLTKAQARLRDARAEYRRFIAGADTTSPRVVRQIVRLKLEVRHAEAEVSSAERSLAGVQAMQRAVMLESS